MKTNYKNYALFDYVSVECSNPFNLGDIVIKEKDYEGGICNEIGVVLQIHDETELRTDMFGNECVDMLRIATIDEIKVFRYELYKDIITIK